MSGWFGSMGTAHDGYLTHDANKEAMAEKKRYQYFHEVSAQSAEDELARQARIKAAASKDARRNDLIKKAGVGLVAGAVVGMALLKVPAYSKMMTKQKSWQAAAVGAAVAVPLAAMYA